MEQIKHLFDREAWKERIACVVRDIWRDKVFAIPALSYLYTVYARFSTGLDGNTEEVLNKMVFTGVGIWVAWLGLWMIVGRFLIRSWVIPWSKDPDEE